MTRPSEHALLRFACLASWVGRRSLRACLEGSSIGRPLVAHTNSHRLCSDKEAPLTLALSLCRVGRASGNDPCASGTSADLL